ncbi:MAG: anthranilate synthase component II [Candidatus Gastranaerophilaceae bacterium]
MILIDNYDSFTYNIVEYFNILGKKLTVYKNDEITIEELENIEFETIILSPGPSNPDNAGITLDIIKRFYQEKNILGVCLGYQAIAQFFGAKIIKSDNPVHGKCSEIYFNEGEELFKDFKQGFKATRYHSLIVDNRSITSPIKPIAYTQDNILMGIKIENLPIYGVQFHPEAILTKNGINIFKNFCDILEKK